MVLRRCPAPTELSDWSNCGRAGEDVGVGEGKGGGRRWGWRWALAGLGSRNDNPLAPPPFAAARARQGRLPSVQHVVHAVDDVTDAPFPAASRHSIS